MTKENKISRRKFINRTAMAALSAGLIPGPFSSLKSIASNANVNRNRSSYKAIVCVLLEGGADSYNMIIPAGNAEYNEYANSRSVLAIPQNELLSINPLNSDGKLYGLHPSMSPIQSLFNSGELSFISNVGTLIEPVTKEGFWDGTNQLPLGLFSHADQIQQWQSGRPDLRTQIGWGGQISDIMGAINSNQSIPMSVSLSGNNTYQHGLSSIEFSINEEGSAGLIGYDDNTSPYNQIRTTALNSMFNHEYNDPFKNTYIKTIKNANSAGIEFMEAINQIDDFQSPFSENELSQSFKMIAKTIAARDILGFERQVFFIRYPGWDHHSDMLLEMNNMLPVLSNALSEFNAVMNEIGTNEQVTTFSMSDFARSLTSNGNGSDHAWGGNLMVMGGSVNGQYRFGEFPSLALDNPLDVSQGILIPQISTDEYFAEIAMWFGLQNADISNIFPNLSNFYDINSANPPIGFLNIDI